MRDWSRNTHKAKETLPNAGKIHLTNSSEAESVLRPPQNPCCDYSERTLVDSINKYNRLKINFSNILLRTGSTNTGLEDYLKRLKTVLTIFQDADLRLNRDKCKWLLIKEIEDLGFRISADC